MSSIKLEDVLVKPLLTEKTSKVSEDYNKYGFEVLLHANKHQIKSAVEKYFDVKVLDVNTQITSGKVKRVKRDVIRTAKKKRAFVTVKEGQKIEFFKGV